MASIRNYMLMAVPSWVEVGSRSVLYISYLYLYLFLNYP